MSKKKSSLPSVQLVPLRCFAMRLIHLHNFETQKFQRQLEAYKKLALSLKRSRSKLRAIMSKIVTIEDAMKRMEKRLNDSAAILWPESVEQ